MQPTEPSGKPQKVKKVRMTVTREFLVVEGTEETVIRDMWNAGQFIGCWPNGWSTYSWQTPEPTDGVRVQLDSSDGETVVASPQKYKVPDGREFYEMILTREGGKTDAGVAKSVDAPDSKSGSPEGE